MMVGLSIIAKHQSGLKSPTMPLVGVAVQGMDRMEVCGRADETQDGAPVA